MTDLSQGVINSESDRQTTIKTERRHRLAFNKCCFCFPLRTACLILAYLYLVATIANLILTILSIVSIMAFILRVQTEPQLIPYILLHVIKLVLLLVVIPCNVLLLLGLHKENPNHVKIFTIFQLVFIIVYVFQFIGFAAAGYIPWQIILMELVFIGISVCLPLAMWSQYVTMCNNKNPRQGRICLEAVNTTA